MDEEKNCASNLKIRKYAFFLIIEKGMNKEISSGYLRHVTVLFLIFEKGMSKKLPQGILELISTLFVRFEKEMSK